MGDRGPSSKSVMHEKKEVLNMLREIWLEGNSSLRRIYSSWEQLEENLQIASLASSTRNKNATQSCPNCGVKQEISKLIEGIFPYQICRSCKHPFYVRKDMTVRKLSGEEIREIPSAWFKVVEDLDKKKVAVVFKIE